MQIQVGNIVTTTEGQQLLVTKVHEDGIEGNAKLREGGTPSIAFNWEIAEVQYLHGDRFSYELRQQWA